MYGAAGVAAPHPASAIHPTAAAQLRIVVFMAFLDVTIVNVAFPSIERAFPGTSGTLVEEHVLPGGNPTIAFLASAAANSRAIGTTRAAGANRWPHQDRSL